MEISTRADSTDPQPTAYRWMIDKRTLNVKKLNLNSRDNSASVQERYFDSREIHSLEHLTYEDISKNLLDAVAALLDQQR